MNTSILMREHEEKGHLPRFVSATEAVAQGQKPVHMMLRSLPVRQTCCSNLHCKEEREGNASKIFTEVTAGRWHGENGLSCSSAFLCDVKIKNSA